MMSKKSTQALLCALSLALCTLAAPPAHAQTRAALVQNMDEPGRNPYQEMKPSTNCLGQTYCRLSYAAVPAGKRLVVTNISGSVDLESGIHPFGLITTDAGIPYVTFTAVTGPVVVGVGTRMLINQSLLAYFGPGEIPRVSINTESYRITSGLQVQLSGYYITLP